MAVKTMRRILFIAEGQLGDCLLLTPAIRAVKNHFPSASISVLVVDRRIVSWSSDDLLAPDEYRKSSALSTNPYVDELFVVSRRSLRSMPLLERVWTETSIVRSLRKRRMDAVVCTFPEDRFALWAFSSGARLRVGQIGQPFHFLLTHLASTTRAEHGVLRYYCDLVRLLGVDVTDLRTEYRVAVDSERWASDFLGSVGVTEGEKLITVHPGATGDYKIWPPDRYAAMIDRLTEHHRIVLCRGMLDDDVVSNIRDALHTNRYIVADTGPNVGHLAALLQRSALCISNDSGPRHLAAALGTPTLALFRRHHQREWGIYPQSDSCRILQGSHPCPVCPAESCHDVIPPEERFGAYCIRMIEVNEACEAAEGIVGG
jgi:heptosyltransferase-2